MTGSNTQTQILLDSAILKHFTQLLRHHDSNIQKVHEMGTGKHCPALCTQNLKLEVPCRVISPTFFQHSNFVASSPGHSQILSRSHGEKSGEGLGAKLRHRPEMVDSVCTKVCKFETPTLQQRLGKSSVLNMHYRYIIPPKL